MRGTNHNHFQKTLSDTLFLGIFMPSFQQNFINALKLIQFFFVPSYRSFDNNE
jgi:hypothetical protein